MVTFATSLLLGIALGAEPVLVDDFDGGVERWTARSNVTLSAEQAEGCLRADLDLSEANYGWFRRKYAEAPPDLSRLQGLSFRARGGGPECRISVHLMSDASTEKPPTLHSIGSYPLDTPQWEDFVVSWEELAVQGSPRPVSPEDLRHIEVVNLSVTGPKGAHVTVWIDDVVCRGLTAQEIAMKRQTPGGRARIADDREFWALLDEDRFPQAAAAVASDDRRRAAAELLAHMRGRSGPSYYFDPADTQALVEAMVALSPNYPESVLGAADRLLAHEYTWEGETRSLSRPIDYVQDGSEWTAVLNRFGFLENLQKAYWFSGRERYAEEVIGQMTEWIAGCPVPTHGRAGRTWHPLEVGCRADTWLRYYLGLLHSESMTPETNLSILRSLAEHARFLADPDLQGGAPNMIVVEGTALCSLAILLPEFRDSGAWLQRGLQIVDGELRRRMLGDGAWEEVTPGYHGWVAQSCLGLSVLCARNGVELPAGYEDRFRAMYEWTLKITKPDGHTPMLGDAGDSGVGGAMAQATAFFESPQFRFFAPEALPLGLVDRFGPEVVARYGAVRAAEPTYGSLLLEHSRLAVMRTGYRPDDSYLLFDFGPIWSHTHEDTLGLELYALGQTLLWDSGVSNYNMPECRGYYRQARAHNIVLVDDSDMRLGPEPPVLHGWESTEVWDFVDAEASFTGPEVTHRRQVLFVKPHCWVIRDVLRARAPRRYERLFHVREHARVLPEADRAVAREGEGPVLAIVNAGPAGAETGQTEGLITYHHGRGPGSSNLPAPVVRITTDAEPGTAELVTVLLAAPTPEELPRVTVGEGGRRIGVGAVTVLVPEAEADGLPPLRVQ